MALYGNQGMGQFGSPNFPGRDFPLPIIQQYPGTQNLQEATGIYGNLLYGPASNAYQISAAQAADPAAEQFQAPGQGAFAQPGAGSAELGNLFAGQMRANVAGQQTRQKQQTDAAKGMLDTFNAYAQDIYGTQTAANKLEEAKLQAQEQQQGALIDLGGLAATLATGNPIFLEGAGMVSGSGMQPGAANAFASLGTGSPTTGFSGGLYGRYFGSPAPGTTAPTGPYGGVTDPSAVDLLGSGLYS